MKRPEYGPDHVQHVRDIQKAWWEAVYKITDIAFKYLAWITATTLLYNAYKRTNSLMIGIASIALGAMIFVSMWILGMRLANFPPGEIQKLDLPVVFTRVILFLFSIFLMGVIVSSQFWINRLFEYLPIAMKS